MSAYSSLIAYLVNVIKTNNNEDITGAILQQVLLDMIVDVGANQLGGIATVDTQPDIVKGYRTYLASQPGNYTGFGLSIASEGIYTFSWNPNSNEWVISQLDINSLHDRAHSITSEFDHIPVTGADKGKLVATDAETGKVILIELSSILPDVIWERNDITGTISPKVITDKLGVNTYAPTRELDVNGKVRIRNTTLGNTYIALLTVDKNGNVEATTKQNLTLIPEGTKSSAIDAGIRGESSLGDDYLYVCVKTGVAGEATWKKATLFQT